VYLPEQKRQRTQKVLDWSRRVREPVYRYNDEAGLERALDAVRQVLLMDLIKKWADEPMPYDRWMREAMPSLDTGGDGEGANYGAGYLDYGEDEVDQEALAAAAAAAYTDDRGSDSDVS